MRLLAQGSVYFPKRGLICRRNRRLTNLSLFAGTAVYGIFWRGLLVCTSSHHAAAELLPSPHTAILASCHTVESVGNSVWYLLFPHLTRLLQYCTGMAPSSPVVIARIRFRGPQSLRGHAHCRDCAEVYWRLQVGMHLCYYKRGTVLLSPATATDCHTRFQVCAKRLSDRTPSSMQR